MTYRAHILAATAAALLLSTPLFAHEHGHGAAMQHGEESCPHHQATATAVSQALTLLEQAEAQTGDTAKATIAQARQQLTEAQKQMASCQEMCKTMRAKGEGEHECPMHATHAAGHEAGEAEMVTDPVCFMKIDRKTAAAQSVYAGTTYYFCSKGEKEQFDKDPASYLESGE